ncbi:MAG TPA: glycerol-3-phosphate 1-O-acyltransferase [Candidatus Omnitrophica bacterium]|nr:glycerol-3-phosphate 1-O-acyltransferase [Candidatus Omnitrophota bacterium]
MSLIVNPTPRLNSALSLKGQGGFWVLLLGIFFPFICGFTSMTFWWGGVKIITLAVLSYLAGSVPFGLIISKKVKGLDVRKFGSGNIGATNVVRVVGLKWGVLVFILDFLKGFLPVILVFFFLQPENKFINISAIITALLAITGHNWPVFLKFKGGKGVSTSLGVITALSGGLPFLRIPLLISLGSWIAVFLIFRIVGLASIITSLAFFISCLSLQNIPLEFKILSFLIFSFITIRHKKNIQELLVNKKKRS